MKASVKYKVIYRHRKKYSISEMCRFLGVSRSGYYGYVKRMEIPAKDLPLAEKIRECQVECKSTYGYRRVHIWLERQGIHHDPKTVLRVMNKYCLLSVIRRKRYVKYGEALHRYPNLLNRNFAADRPNQKWVTDISYIRTGQGFLYLSVIRDLYDNSIVAYKTGTEQTVSLVLSTIVMHLHISTIGIGVRCSAGELIKQLIDQSADKKIKYLILEADPCQHETLKTYAKTKNYHPEDQRGFILTLSLID